MAGERSKSRAALVAQASARFARRMALINDYYASTSMNELTMAELEKIYEQWDAHGHFNDGEVCDDPLCQKAYQYVNNAIQQAQAMAQQGAQ